MKLEIHPFWFIQRESQMLRNVLFCVALIFSGWFTANAQAHPDFSGTWQLNVEKSDYGDLQGPETRTDIIEQHDGSISESVTAEERHHKRQYTMVFATNGTQTTLSPEAQMSRVPIISVSALWRDSALIVTQKLRFQGATLVATNLYTLSSDGKTFTIALALGGSETPAATFVFDRL